MFELASFMFKRAVWGLDWSGHHFTSASASSTKTSLGDLEYGDYTGCIATRDGAKDVSY